MREQELKDCLVELQALLQKYEVRLDISIQDNKPKVEGAKEDVPA